MKGFLAGVFVTAPLTALIMFFVLQGKHDVQLQQERLHVEQRLDELRFDRSFDRAWDELSSSRCNCNCSCPVCENSTSNTVSSTRHVAKEQDERDKEIARLKERKAKLDQEFDRQWEQFGKDLEDFRDAIPENFDNTKTENFQDVPNIPDEK
jgi:flagellar motility protein MotE (MotC chaperone)